MKAAAYVEIKFLEGDVMRLPFACATAAQAFFTRAQARHDALTVRFIDPELERGYAQSKGELP